MVIPSCVGTVCDQEAVAPNSSTTANRRLRKCQRDGESFMRVLRVLGFLRRMIAFYLQKRQYSRVAGNQCIPKRTCPSVSYVRRNCIAMKQRRISATYMRGGTSKGDFFRRADLPRTPFA